MATQSTNPFRAARQRRKAYAVSRRIWAHLTPSERTNPRLPEVVAAMTADERFGWAIEAGTPPLSDESWAICVQMIRDKVEDERHWLSIEAAG